MNTLNYSSKVNAIAIFKNITFSAYKLAKGAKVTWRGMVVGVGRHVITV